MTRLLHIQVSPRSERSTSIAVAERFLEVYRAKHPGSTVETLNFWEAERLTFDGATIDAKYVVLHKQTHLPLSSKLDAPTTLSLPNWNFGIPYKLK